MKTVNVHEAKAQLSRLLAEVVDGREILVTRGKVPVAKLVPVAPLKRQFGALKGQFSFEDSFFDPLPADELAAWGEV